MQLLIFITLIFIVNFLVEKNKKITFISMLKILGISVFATVVFQVLAYFIQGYIDPFFMIAATLQIVAGVVIGFLAMYIKGRFFIN